jgi:nicotinamide-nucleotide amidase
MTLEKELVAALTARGQTVATAESLTAGLVCARLADVPGASAVLRGGLVVYATELKTRLAGVSEQLLAVHGPLHPDVAAQLAQGARDRCGADWGLGLTGVAGPGSQDGAPAGTVYVGLAWSGGQATRMLRLPGDRPAVRAGAVDGALRLLREHLG